MFLLADIACFGQPRYNMAKMSRQLRGAITATKRQAKRRQVVGYVLIAVMIVGLLYICWWVFTHEDSRRFRGIEKFRGGIETPSRPKERRVLRRLSL